MAPYIPVLVVAALIGLAWLDTRTRLGNWLNKWVSSGESHRLKNPAYAVLRREIAVFGKELEVLPYERLLKLHEEEDSELESQTRVVDGFHLTFTTEIFGIDKNGDLHICIDGWCHELQWWFRALPSYVFTKRKDGTVY